MKFIDKEWNPRREVVVDAHLVEIDAITGYFPEDEVENIDLDLTAARIALNGFATDEDISAVVIAARQQLVDDPLTEAQLKLII